MSKQIRKANVLSTKQITPHLQRIVLGSDEFKGLSTCYIGNYVKVLIPDKHKINVDIKTACIRSYTIAELDAENGAITLDFVINMHQGPATRWAQSTKVGDRVAIAGPGPKKLDNYDHNHYVLLGDLTSVNAIKAYLELLPKSASIDTFIHVPTAQDIIRSNTTRHVNWLVTSTPDKSMLNALSNLVISEQPPIVFMALEAGLVRKVKAQLNERTLIPRCNIVASGYWKKGLNSERYKRLRQRAAKQACIS